MDSAKVFPLPARDPVSGGALIITELEGPETGVTIRGRFEMPRFAQLSGDQARYLETFLRCRGMLNSVERELGISYPTARARLDAVLRALDLHEVREDSSVSLDEPPYEPESVPTSVEFQAAPGAAQVEPTSADVDTATWNVSAEAGSAVEFESAYQPETTSEVSATDIDASAFEGYAGGPPTPQGEPTPRRTRDEILTLLEKGEITPEEAKKELAQ